MEERTHDLGIDGLGPGVQIGEGGSAVVFRARQEVLDREVAVKVLRFSVDEATKRRFDRERRVMGRLSQHDGIVTVYETGFTERGEPYIVMPLLSRSLADETAEHGPMPWDRSAEIIAEACRSVQFAHDQGIVHRDLKPANILLSASERPLVADFGIARIVDSNTHLKSTALTLTPAYSPPEALEATVAQPASDVYSLGATLYALVVGHPPYVEPDKQATLMTLMRRINDDPVPDMRPAAPDSLQAVLERAMAKQPEARFASVGEMAEALEACRSGHTGATSIVARDLGPEETVVRALPLEGVPPVGPPTDPHLPASSDGASGDGDAPVDHAQDRPRRALWATVAAAAVVLLAIGGLLALGGGDDGETTAPQSSEQAVGAETVGSAAPDLGSDIDPDVTAGSDTTSASDESDSEPDIDATETIEADPTDTTSPDTTEPEDVIVAGGEVFLQPIDAIVDDPFTTSVAAPPDDATIAFALAGGPPPAEPPPDGSADPAPAESAPAGSTTVPTRVGTDPGVFAGTQGVAPCDPAAMLAELTPDNPATAAWASVQGIGPDQIPEFVSRLTPIVLTADTRVTDHGFVDGASSPRQAVLQVGTAVMVDDFGEPRVRCASGSPLSAPEPVEGTTRYIGGAWETFDPAFTSVVTRAPEPVEQFVLTDVSGGPQFIRQVGTTGAGDLPLQPGEVLAVGGFTSYGDLFTVGVNTIELVFRPEGGPVDGTFQVVLSLEGFEASGAGTLTGTYDPATATISGNATVTASSGGFGETGEGPWSATIDPVAGTIVGQAGTEGGATFLLAFPPYAT